ncbi:formate dehydrogenase [Shewanella mangrovi]|uniref:Protein FdhE homolog n=1 Tax=Shewanella mangrovi TaxID=1515746 RepID=A0A094JYD8_9GAMM|nr:formate dehydrogenase accessory protein FdhE [Shewanella mangrovi]KFZ37416.1 formate dehydrogenase [Shewanella mangrovi]
MTIASEIPLSFADKSPLAIKPVIAADQQAVYQHRAERLAKLAEDSPLADYLTLCVSLVSTQQTLCDTDMGPAPEVNVNQAMPLQGHGSNQYWIVQLQLLLTQLLDKVPSSISPVVKRLMCQTPEQLQKWGNCLWRGHFSQVPAEYRLFIWAALAVYWGHWAPAVIARMDVNQIKQQTKCPVCGSHPVASVVVDKPREGLRYLHCSLCDSEWHYVRAHCTSCNQSKAVELWSFESHQAPIRVESCDDCDGYTKMLFLNLAPQMDAVADDLASMGLDAKLAEKGFHATTVNPLLLADEVAP